MNSFSSVRERQESPKNGSVLNSRLQGLKVCNKRTDMKEMNSQGQLFLRIKHAGWDP